MATYVDNLRLPDLISKWLEVQKYRCQKWDLKAPLTVDAVNLTLILKALGFKLENFDFDPDSNALKSETVTIEIKCHKSGIKSSLTYNLVNCTCPEKTQSGNAAFWEVQATGPMISRFKSATYKDSSSNLLPELSENCSQVAQAILSNLLDYYQENIREVASERSLKSPLRVYSPRIMVTSPGMTMRSPYSTPPAEGKSSTFVYPTPSPAKSETGETTPKIPEIRVDDKKETIKDEQKDDTVVIDGPDLLAQVPSTTFDFPENSEPDSKFFTSSPNERPSVPDDDRDLHVIQSLTNARQQIDNALLFMKINGAISLPDRLTSVITNTPQQISSGRKSAGSAGAIPKLPQRASSFTSLQLGKPSPAVSMGRKSLGPTVTPLTTKPSLKATPKTITPITVVKKKITTSSTIATSVTTKFVKTDTPRPILTSSLSRSKPISTSTPGTVIRKPSSLVKSTSQLAKPKPVSDLKKK